MVCSTPEAYFLKRKGTQEYEIAGTSKLVTDAILGGKVVTREQYDAY